MLKRIAPAVLLAALLAASTAPAASAETPCWKHLINDWYDGRIDDTYAIPCYRAAIKHLPTDAQTYSSAAEDISAALALVIAGKDPSSGSGTTTGGTDGSGGSGGGTGGSGSGGPGTGGTGGTGGGGAGTGSGGPVGGALDDLGPNDAESVPIVVIVLGAIAVLLVALGGAGLVVRRVHARRAQLRAVSTAPPAQET